MNIYTTSTGTMVTCQEQDVNFHLTWYYSIRVLETSPPPLPHTFPSSVALKGPCVLICECLVVIFWNLRIEFFMHFWACPSLYVATLQTYSRTCMATWPYHWIQPWRLRHHVPTKHLMFTYLTTEGQSLCNHLFKNQDTNLRTASVF
jgi:hypothetical protein